MVTVAKLKIVNSIMEFHANGGPKCRNNLHSSAHNIVVTMGGGDANEDKHAHDDNDDHNDLTESQRIEIHIWFIFYHIDFVS